MFLRVCGWWLAAWFAYSAFFAYPTHEAATPPPAEAVRDTAPSGPTEVATVQTGETEAYAAYTSYTSSEWIERNKRMPWFHSESDLKGCKRVVVTATGYYAGPESTGKRPGDRGYGVTFSGVKARRDIYSTIAADPSVFPIGTEMYVPGYGYAVVADTGSAVKGHVIDLYFEKKDQIYREWGKRRVEVIVLRLGNGKLTEETMRKYNDLGSRREVASPGCF